MTLGTGPVAEEAGGDPPPGFVSELVRRRYRYRQFIGIAFCLVVTGFGEALPGWFVAGCVLNAIGFLVRLWASGHVHKNVELTTTGPYGWVRHPLYLGNLLIGTGFCAASGLLWSVPAWAVLWWIFYPAAIEREDARLSHHFPDEWSEWSTRTPAVLPRSLPKLRDVRRRWSLVNSFKNGEPYYVGLLTGALFWIATSPLG